jgi:hypothetical protein
VRAEEGRGRVVPCIDTPPLDASRLHSVAFLIHPEDTPYDVWLDEVRFLTTKSWPRQPAAATILWKHRERKLCRNAP